MVAEWADRMKEAMMKDLEMLAPLPGDKCIEQVNLPGEKNVRYSGEWTTMETMEIRLGRIPKTTRTLICKGKIPSGLLPRDLVRLRCTDIKNETIENFPSNLQILLIQGAKNLKHLPKFPEGVMQASIQDTGVRTIESLSPNLETLLCIDSPLTSLPELSPKLVKLQLNKTQLRELPTLPSSIRTMQCNLNQLEGLPPLPEQLQRLDCTSNKIQRLPALPKGLRNLLMDKNSITELPELPEHLQILLCSENRLTSLPSLPGRLTELICSNNRLTSLPPLPQSLKMLQCRENQLTSLPALPSELQYLRVGRNKELKKIPELPRGFQMLECVFCSIETIPSLPESLIYIFAGGNELTMLPILPDAVKQIGFEENPLDPVFQAIQKEQEEESGDLDGLREEIQEIQDDMNEAAGPSWNGWNQDDIGKLDIIFEKEAVDYACCPICLKFVERSEACMQMRHNCKAAGGFYHKKLQKAQKNPEGFICWCTICGRISLGHRHQKVATSGSKPPALATGSGDPFEGDCSKTNGGGGLLEKLKRFRRIRETALDLQKKVGAISEKKALETLVEKAWNAPLSRAKGQGVGPQKHILETKTWNIPTTAFPAAPRGNAAPNTNAPNLPGPNAGLMPKVEAEGTNFMGEDGPLLHFRHREEGGVNEHTGYWITSESLTTFIENAVKNFGEESFGQCQMYPGKCKSRLQPQEIKGHVPDALQEEYRKKFNRKFAAEGGARRTRKIRRGGQHEEPRSIFVEATDAMCIPPWKSKGGTRKRTKRNRRRTVRRR